METLPWRKTDKSDTNFRNKKKKKKHHVILNHIFPMVQFQVKYTRISLTLGYFSFPLSLSLLPPPSSFFPHPATLFPAFLAVCFARAIARVKSRQPILPLIVEFPAFFFTAASSSSSSSSRWKISRGEAKMTAKITLAFSTA